MIACGGVSGSSSPIYVSNNYGATWTTAGPTLTWYSCAMSTSGQYMYAGTSSATAVYVSSNYGQTWTPVTVHSSATQSFSITCSASGQYVCTTDTSQYIYYSSNYGLTWTRATSPVAPFGGMAMSASGQYVIAGGTTADNQALYYSINYGQNWTIVPSSPTGNWFACAISANGQYLLGASLTATNLKQSITRFPPQSITSQSTTTSTALSLLAPNISGTQNVGIVLGRSIISNNYATIGFQYIGDGSASNYIGIGVTAPSTLCITGTNNVGIGITNPAAQLHIYSTTSDRTNSLYVASKQAGIYLDGTQSGGGANSWNVWVGKTTGDYNAGGLNFFSVNSGSGLFVLSLGINGGASLTGSLTINSYIFNYNSTYSTLTISNVLSTTFASGAQHNVCIGTDVGKAITTGAFNTLCGPYSGIAITTGNNNVIIGQSAGGACTTGSLNVYVGNGAGLQSNASVTNEIVIATRNSAGKGANTGFIDPNGGGVYQGNNATTWSQTSDVNIKKKRSTKKNINPKNSKGGTKKNK
jgi:hypothetical protein